MEQLSITISPMTTDALDAVAALEQECFAAPWSREALAAELENPRAVFLVATLPTGQVAGYAGMHHIVDEGYITNVAVTATARRTGVASALLKALVSYGEENNLSMLTLEVRASNQGAIALYNSFAFKQEGLRRGYYHTPPEDALILTRHL